ncbi:hypothetical protein FACS189430_10710 [Bacteroidia bacterium]|nr:hypothetical protein FACS189430_10710 [Bacteroidia bacterium]
MARRADFIPRSDRKFNSWAIVLLRYIGFHSAEWDVPADAFTALQSMLDPWTEALSNAENPEMRTKAVVDAKNALRKAFVAEIRRVVKAYIIYNPAVSDSDRDNMGLPVHDTTPTPIPVPQESPIVEVDFSSHQQHLVTVKSIAGRAKPSAAHGFELWGKVGTPAPTTDSDFRYVGFATKSPFTVHYELSEVGTTVFYRAHWVNAKNEAGPWGDIVNALIA